MSDELKRSFEFFHSSFTALQNGDLRNFCSRFYYGYATLIRFLENLPGDLHKLDIKNKELKNWYKKLRGLRIAADYGFYEREPWRKIRQSLTENEGIIHDLISFIEDTFIPYMDTKSNQCEEEIDLIRDKLEVIALWLRNYVKR